MLPLTGLYIIILFFYAEAIFEKLIPVIITPQNLLEKTPAQRVKLNVTAISDKLLSTNVLGTRLWDMDIFFSQSEDGSGTRIDEQTDILTPTAQMVPLEKDADLCLDDVMFEVDLRDQTCADIPFMCVELRKNPSTSIDYTFGTNPEQVPFVGCLNMTNICRGVIAKNLNWAGEIPDFVDGPLETVQNIVSNASIDVETVLNNLTGDNLWQMSVFASSTKSAGSDDILLPYFDQILTEEQSRLPVPEDGVLRFYNLETPPFQVDRMGCGKFKFLCYRFQKASRSDADFAFHTDSGKKYVLNCQELVCKAVTPKKLDWTIESIDSAPGRRTPTTLDVTTKLRNDTRDVNGTRLWRLGLYGSNSEFGVGPKFDEVYQLLTDERIALPIENRKPLKFGELVTQFEIGTIGCVDNVNYVCLEFEKNTNPDPDYVIIIQDKRGDDVKSLISCKRKLCEAKAVLEALEATHPSSLRIFEGTEDQDITVSLDAITNKLESTNVAGDYLWDVTTFFSPNVNGEGNRILEQTQILNQLQARTELVADENIGFPDVEFATDLSNHECSEIPYICYQIRKNPWSSINYEFLPDSEIQPIINCTSTKDICKGVIARFLTWSSEDGDGDRLPGEKGPIKGDVTVDVVPSSRDLEGNNLWRLSTYASSDPFGTRKVSPVMHQVLTPSKASTSLEDGGPLVFENVETEPYPLDQLGCGEARYLCFELRKSNESDVDFAFETTTGEDALIECVEQECQSVFLTNMNWTLTEDDPVPGQKSLVNLDIETNFQNRSRAVFGDDLWQVRLFASNLSAGDGERIGETNRVLSYYQAGQIIEQPESTILFEGADVYFDIGSVGCKDYVYVCVEFRKGEDPSTNFTMIVVENDELTTKTSLHSCKERVCSAKVTFEDLNIDVKTDKLIEGVADQEIEFDVEGIPDILKSTNVGGENLWNLKAYIYGRDGRDQVGATLTDIISDKQKNQPFLAGDDFSFDDLSLELDLADRLCHEVPFLCFELEKDPGASINYAFKTIPKEEPMRKCVPLEPICEGKFSR
ncbi:5 alpha fibrillar collagen [Apostichopus japonicus]|uniref:5 alpha fibrillar collagen n=1 Tax=Stichopus japonicus TaxID=307972 RepID=A0A2G8K3V2_STIJA|nr:5 alpha fibrillar collagen [Apostichopus japonicus]